MPLTPEAFPDPDAARQAAYDALKALQASAESAKDNPANTQAARDTAKELYETTDDQIFSLDQAKITEDSIALQASEAQLTSGMKELQALKKKIEAIGTGIKEASDILCGIDSACSKLSKLGPLL